VPVVVAPETFQLVHRALTGWQMTDARFDPTMLTELHAAGYDRSFKLLKDGQISSRETQPPVVPHLSRLPCPSAHPSAPDIQLDPIVGTVQLGSRTMFDPGGIGKGFAADLVVEQLSAMGARGVLVSVGGDLRVVGEPPAGSSWVVAIADPLDPQQVLGVLCLEAGAVASSWRTKRAWVGPDGQAHHHLIDPRTGMSATNGIAGVTVVTRQGWHAEVPAKAAFLAGPADGVTLIARAGAAGILVGDDGSMHPAGNIHAFLHQSSADVAPTSVEGPPRRTRAVATGLDAML
jgi:thiamine biosynthesis lipoprotein